MKFNQVVNEANIALIANKYKNQATRASLFAPRMIRSIESQDGLRELTNDEATTELRKLGVDLSKDSTFANIVKNATANASISTKKNPNENPNGNSSSKGTVLNPKNPNLGAAHTDNLIRKQAKNIGWG